MKIHPFLPIAFFTLFFTACNGNFFESTVKIEIPDHTSALAVTSQLATGDSILFVFVSKSQGILDNATLPVIEDATVEVLKNGQSLGNLTYYDQSFYRLHLPAPLQADGAVYELKVSAEGLIATSLQAIPVAVPILSGAFEEEGAFNADGEKIDEISIEFQDPAGEDNYYALRVWVFYDSLNQYQESYENLDPLGEDTEGGTVLKDDSFDGKKYTWRVGQYSFGEERTKIRVELVSISRDKYLFQRSVYLSGDADDNPFAEPVIIHNNITGGYGIFSAEAASEVVIEL